MFNKDRHNKDGLESACKECRRHRPRKQEDNRERSKAWRQANPDLANANRERWMQMNKEIYAQAQREWRKENAEKIRTYGRQYAQQLRDCYVRQGLAKQIGVSAVEVPQSMVDAKRAVMRVVRAIKEQTK